MNINDIVRVKLTDFGKSIYYHQYDRLNESYGKQIIQPFYPKVDKDGYTSFQLWNLMKLYGQFLSMGRTIEKNTLPFETNILIG